MMIRNFLLVGLGGAIGSMVRYGAYILIGPRSFPVSTLLINLLGSLIIGIVIGLDFRHSDFSNEWKLFLAVGVCGGFTTFSSFSIENIHLLQSGKFILSALYILSSLIVCLGAAWLGYYLGAKS